MPLIQGIWPKSNWSRVYVGEDQNGRFLTNVVEYRGRPYAAAAAFEKAGFDYDSEVAKVSRQAGLRVVGVALTTGTQTTSH